jgi:protocatechuate 4,5-dioxygenase beta chain
MCVVVLYNDHGLNFFLDKMPTFAVGAAPEYRNADEGWGIPTVPPSRATRPVLAPDRALVGEEFDLTTCQEMKVDHAFTLPMALLWPDQAWPVRVVPVCINTVQAPLPSASRCYKLGPGHRPRRGELLARRREGGGAGHGRPVAPARRRARRLHQQGLRPEQFMDSLTTDPTWACQYDTHQLVEQTGTQGVELLMWLATRGMLGDKVNKLHSNYHIPISNTASGLMLPAGGPCPGAATFALNPCFPE